MWIRSQDEEVLLNLNNVTALSYHRWYEGVDDHGPAHGIVAYINGMKGPRFELGRYHTKKRVFEVLEEIEDEIAEDGCSVYYMPLD